MLTTVSFMSPLLSDYISSVQYPVSKLHINSVQITRPRYPNCTPTVLNYIFKVRMMVTHSKDGPNNVVWGGGVSVCVKVDVREENGERGLSISDKGDNLGRMKTHNERTGGVFLRGTGKIVN